MDRIGSAFESCVAQMRDRLGANAVPLQIPLGKEETFKGVIDLVLMKAYVFHDETLGAEFETIDIPAEYQEAAKKARDFLIEKVAEHDEQLMSKFIEGHEPSLQELKAGIRKATIAIKILPIICGTSYKNKGGQQLLDAVVDYLPAPMDVPAII